MILFPFLVVDLSMKHDECLAFVKTCLSRTTDLFVNRLTPHLGYLKEVVL